MPEDNYKYMIVYSGVHGKLRAGEATHMQRGHTHAERPDTCTCRGAYLEYKLSESG